MAAVNLIGSYNYTLVALSVLIAMFASYAALDLAGRVTATGGWTRAVWLLGGACAMGTGIWSMHYIGMLAFVLPVPVAYHWPTVLLSLVAAILASVVALGVVSRQKMGWLRALAGSVLMGAGIAGMHYIGMAAMRIPAMCQYDSFLVVLSVVFAVLISLAALWITFHFRDEKTGTGWEKLAGAVVMGAAIPVMHYTGMAAASFTPSSMPMDLSQAVSISTLGTGGIAAVTFVVLGLALLTSSVDRRSVTQALEVQEEKLQQTEAYLSEAQRLSHAGSFGWRVSTGDIVWSEETFRIFQYDRTTKPTVELILQRVHPEDAAFVQQTIERAAQGGNDFDHQYRLVMPDRSIKHVQVVAHALNAASGGVDFVGTVIDVTERKRAEEERERLRQAHEDLARVNRVTTMGELTASLAHEVNQPIAAAITNANACLRWLAGDAPNLEEARAAARRIVKDGTRAAEIISRIRLLFKKGTPERELVEINEVIREMIVLLRSETTQYSISVRTELTARLPRVLGDRVQLQQVLMNLILNGIEAMKDVEGMRELALKSQRTENEQLLVTVRDTGKGLPPQRDQIFDAFFTTKPLGLGMGLSISRSIVESHGGRLWASDSSPRGATFSLTLPTKV
ncbi:MAG: PAS domain S-box protein [Deltaproteobacteria bacterium]|nr:MAG: PAS domain S-box protein [Deltaproteobacteria bacterium]